MGRVVVVWRLKGLGRVGWEVEEDRERVERKVELERLEELERRRVEVEEARVRVEEEGLMGLGLETVRDLMVVLSFLEGMIVGGPRGKAGGRLEDRMAVCWRGRRDEEDEDATVVPVRDEGREDGGRAEGLGT